MSDTPRAVLVGVFILGSCIWVGGYVAIAVVARVATRTLDPAQRVAFFRDLGRAYLRVGGPALVVALGTGTALLSGRAVDGILTATYAAAAALIGTLVVGVVQARSMTQLRMRAMAASSDPALIRDIRRGARSAVILRAAIGLLSLALVALGSLLAS
jgi:uncharacterized membrane protein